MRRTASAALVLAFLAWVLVVVLEILALGAYFRWQSSGNEVIMPTAVAVYGACVKIQGLVTVGVNGMGSGLIPIVAYNYGARKPGRIYQSCRWATLYSVAFYSVFFLIMELVPEQVLLLFDASGEMLVIGVTALRIMAASYLLSNICLTYSAAFQGLGMGVQSMLLTLSRQVVLPVVFIAVLSRLGNLSLIWMAFVLAASVSATGKIANKKLVWRTSNKKYATVNANGKVTAKKAGRGKTVLVTAKATDGSLYILKQGIE